MGKKDNFQSPAEMKQDLTHFSFKSSKKRASFGLGFSIQILKDAKYLFHKKRNQNYQTDLYESAPLKKENLNNSYQTSINTFKNFFPHVIATTISSDFNQMHPPSINSLQTSFQSISSTYSPTTSSITKSHKKQNKPTESDERTNIENEIENGNFYQEWQTRAKTPICKFNTENFLIKNDCNYKQSKDTKKCLCFSKNENSKRSRKRKYSHPVIPAPEGTKGRLITSSSESEDYFLQGEMAENLSTDSSNEPQRLHKTSLLHRIQNSSLSSNYFSTSDEEGGLDTSLSSDEGLSSNLSLFTSAEGDDDLMALIKSTTDLTEDRQILSKIGALQERGNYIRNDSLFTRPDTRSICKREEQFLRENANISTTTTTTTTTTATTTTTTTTRQGIINPNFTIQLPGGEINYSRKRHMATTKVANDGISCLINNKFKSHEGLPSDVFSGGYNPLINPLFRLNLMSEKPINKSRFSSWDSYKRREELSKAPATPFNPMKGEFELSSRLDFVSREKELLEASITPIQLANLRAEGVSNAKLDSLTQQYEERITELHSVIAELTRKLDRQKEDVILEEDEEEEEEDIEEHRVSRVGRNSRYKDVEGVSLSELSSQDHNETTECSTSEAESEALYNRDERHEGPPQHSTDVSTSCDIDDRAVEAGQCIADLDVSGCRAVNNSIHSNVPSNNDNGTDDITGDDAMCQGSSSVALEEELKMLREENLGLQQALALSQHKASNQRSVIMALSREREIFKRKVRELEKMQPGILLSSHHISDAVMVKGLRGSPLSGALSNSMSSSVDFSVNNTLRAVSPSVNFTHQEEDSSTQDGVKVICKLAERVRLKKAESGDFRVTGSDLSSVGVSTTGVAEQLAAGLQEESDAQELFHALATAGGVFAPHERLKEYELEAERLHARIDHLRAQNDVLTATLSESKACCDRLALKTGRAEAESGALKMGVEVSDQILEAFEVLTVLHEAQIGLLVVTCQVTGVDLGSELGFECTYQDADPLVRIRRAQEQRRTAENVARHLISRIEDSGHKSCKPPGETNGINSMSSSTSSFSSEGAHQEEHMLREKICRLQNERARILACFKSGGDSSPMEDYFPPKTPLNEDEAHKLDLENAVLMQELTAIREDRAELRAQVYLLEREKTGLELRIGTCEAQAAAYCATIDHLKSQLGQLKPTSNSHEESVGDSGAETASSEAESLRRENQLKNRIDDLVATLEKVTKNSEARHQQSQEFISDLKKANSALLTAVDRLKKKYTLRVKRMEQQTVILITKHEEQSKVLKNRIALLEEQLRCNAAYQMSGAATSDSTY